MGDRTNIVIEDNDGDKVYLYSHWDGSEIEKIAKNALSRGKDRHDDFQYLARIVFCEMVQGDVMGTSGYGISSKIGDGREDIVINTDDLTVSVRGADPIPIKQFIM